MPGQVAGPGGASLLVAQQGAADKVCMDGPKPGIVYLRSTSRGGGPSPKATQPKSMCIRMNRANAS